MNTIIQWNCRGLKINFLELTLLVQLYNPIAICLQETHLKETDKISLKGYNMYNTYGNTSERASGGSTIFVRDNVIHSPITLTTDLQAVAVRMSLDKTITLCSVYIPPNMRVESSQLKNIGDQLPSPFMLLGDFNAHNPLWGSSGMNDRGKKLEDFLSKENLCFFNDGSPTYLHPATGTYSSIDLSICDSSLLTDFDWKVHDDLCGSDHFPVVLEHVSADLNKRTPRFKFEKANWLLL